MSLNAKEIATIEPLTEVLRQFLPSSEFTNSAALPDRLPGLAASLWEVYRLSPLPVQAHRRDSPSPSAATSPSWAADPACRPLVTGVPVRARGAAGVAARTTDWFGHPASCQRLGPFRAHACAGAAVAIETLAACAHSLLHIADLARRVWLGQGWVRARCCSFKSYHSVRPELVEGS